MSHKVARRPSGRARQQAAARPAGSWALPLVSVAAIGGALLAIILLTSTRPSAASPTPRPSTAAVSLVTPSAAIPETLATGATLGKAAAPVTVEVWSDYQCPYCGELARNYLPRLVGDFVPSGTLRIHAQDIAFLDRGSSTESRDAAVAAACAGEQGRFWAYHDLLMWNQAGENAGAFAPARLQAMATRVPLDIAAWNSCRASTAARQAVIDRTARASALGISSTPTLVINGQAIVGLPPTYDALASAIRQLGPAASARP